MDRDELFSALAQARPEPEDMVYVERRGPAYAWHRVVPGVELPQSSAGADVWMYFSANWPRDDPERFAAFCADMLAEMESMAGGDRCRWPLSEPYPLPTVSYPRAAEPSPGPAADWSADATADRDRPWADPARPVH